MKMKLLVAGALVVLVAAILYSVLGGSEAPPAADSISHSTPLLAVAKSPERPAREAAAVPPSAMPDAAVKLAPSLEPARDWKAKWEGIPLDKAGTSLSRKGQTTAFSRALSTAIRDELKKCGESRPAKIQQTMNVELFVEGTNDGYDVIGAEVARDAGVDQYTMRCVELAFEQQLTTPDAGGAPAERYHLEFPVMFMAADEQP